MQTEQNSLVKNGDSCRCFVRPQSCSALNIYHTMILVIMVTMTTKAEPITYLDLFNVHQVFSGLAVSIIAALQALHFCLHPAELPLQPPPLSCRLLHCLLPDLGYMRCICWRLPGHCLLQKHKPIVTSVPALLSSYCYRCCCYLLLLVTAVITAVITAVSYCCRLQRLLPVVYALHMAKLVVKQIVRAVAHCKMARQLATQPVLLFLTLLISSNVTR